MEEVPIVKKLVIFIQFTLMIPIQELLMLVPVEHIAMGLIHQKLPVRKKLYRHLGRFPISGKVGL